MDTELAGEAGDRGTGFVLCHQLLNIYRQKSLVLLVLSSLLLRRFHLVDELLTWRSVRMFTELGDEQFERERQA